MQEIFGPYQLIERIAAGGMAEIFKARTFGQSGFEKTLAIKRLHPRYTQHPEFVEMLKEEAKIAVGLSHANIIQIFDLGRVQEHFYIAMEFLNGRDLNQLIGRMKTQGEQPSLEIIIFIISEICAGLDYAHRQRDQSGQLLRLIHRDISPQNIMISSEGEIKIVDFGIAKTKATNLETEAGTLKGKFCFMSPEQSSGRRLDHRTDIFSAGILMYELLCNRPMYEDRQDADLLQQVRRAQYTPIEILRPDLPKSIVKVLGKALAVRKEDRFPSARHFQYALEKVSQKMQLSSSRFQMSQMIQRLFPKLNQSHASEEYVQDYSDFGNDDLSLISDYELTGSGHKGDWEVPDLTDEFMEIDPDDIILIDEESGINPSVIDERPMMGERHSEAINRGAVYPPHPTEPKVNPRETFDRSQAPSYVKHSVRSPQPQGARSVPPIDPIDLYSQDHPAQPSNQAQPYEASPGHVKYPPAAPYRDPAMPLEYGKGIDFSRDAIEGDSDFKDAHQSTLILDHQAEAPPSSHRSRDKEGEEALLHSSSSPQYGRLQGQAHRGLEVESLSTLRGQVKQSARALDGWSDQLKVFLQKSLAKISGRRDFQTILGVTLFVIIFTSVRLISAPSQTEISGADPIKISQAPKNTPQNGPVKLGETPLSRGSRDVRSTPQPMGADGALNRPINAQPQTPTAQIGAVRYPITAQRTQMDPGQYQPLGSPPTAEIRSPGAVRSSSDIRYPSVAPSSSAATYQQPTPPTERYSPSRPGAVPLPAQPNQRPFMLELTTNPQGAEVAVNESWQTSTTPLRIRATEGEALRVTFSMPGYRDERKTIWPQRLRPQYQVNLNPLRGNLVVRTIPAGAKIKLNGQLLGQSPIDEDDLQMSPSKIKVEIRKRGFESEIHSLDWNQADRQRLLLDVELKARPTDQPRPKRAKRKRRKKRAQSNSRPRGYGFISVGSRRWGEVYIDRRKIKGTPLLKHRVSAGRHRVKICFDGNQGQCTEKSVNVSVDGHEKVKF